MKALFIKELDKLYGPGGPNKDMHERAEEMERMREHVFKENDKNRDGLIDYQEFLLEAKKASFNQDEGITNVFIVLCKCLVETSFDQKIAIVTLK